MNSPRPTGADQLPLPLPEKQTPPRKRRIRELAATVTPTLADGQTDRLLRRPEVQYVTGLSRSSLYRLIARNEFPDPVKLSSNTVAWLQSEVVAWIAGRIRTKVRCGPLDQGA